MSESSVEATAINSVESEVSPVALIDQLILDAKNNFGDEGWEWFNRYKGYDVNYDVVLASSPYPLPEKFAPLVYGDDPSRYKVVYFFDGTKRTDGKSVRESHVAISTSLDHKNKEYLKEFEFDKRGDAYSLTVGEYLGGGQNYEHEVPKGLILGGGTEAEYELLPGGGRRLLESYTSRFDEVEIVYEGERRIARWHRGLRTRAVEMAARDSYSQETARYQDDFMIGRKAEQGGRVFITAKGEISNPESIRVGIGKLENVDPVTLHKSRDGRAQVTISRGDMEMIDFLRQFPEYQAILKDRGFFNRISVSDVQGLLQGKVAQLKHDWNNPQSIFIKDPVIG